MAVDPLGIFFAAGVALVISMPVLSRAIDGTWRPFVLGAACGFGPDHRRLRSNIWCGCVYDVVRTMTTPPKDREALVQAAADNVRCIAVVAERERCARVCIAESHRHRTEAQKYPNDSEDKRASLNEAIAAMDCAAAIRKGEPR